VVDIYDIADSLKRALPQSLCLSTRLPEPMNTAAISDTSRLVSDSTQREVLDNVSDTSQFDNHGTSYV
jgi:hypothetical protein